MNRFWKRDCALVFLLAAVLVAPLFRLKYLDNWASIESTFIGDARMLKDVGFRPLWQPLWYCGTRWDYIYPPALRYGTAGIAKLIGSTTARAYHLYTGILYCLGIAGVYLLMRTGSGRRFWAWLGAIAAATLSPVMLLVKDVRVDAMGSYWPPQRLNVLMRYGEGPHMSAFALIPIALAFSWRGLRKGNNGWLVASAIACALVVSNNFYGATALAMFFPLLCWALWLTTREHGVWLRAAAIAVLAYGLCAFWLTPSYFRITIENMQWVASPGNRWSVWVLAVVTVMFGAVSWRMARGIESRAWPVFVWGSAVLFTLNVLGYHYYEFRVIGEPGRLAPEMDLVLIVLLLWLAAWLWDNRPGVRWAVAAALLLTFFFGARAYLRHPWATLAKDPAWEKRIEYRMTTWLKQNLPEARSVATGSVRFWFNAWHNLAELGGGSEQGLLNPNVMNAQWNITGSSPELAILWSKITGVSALLVHDQKSTEQYHDWPQPQKFEGRLQVAWDSGEGDKVYVVPRRYPALARVVDRKQLSTVLPILTHIEDPNLHAYNAVVEGGPASEVTLQRISFEEIQLKAAFAPGQALLVQESYDSAWHAYVGGRPVRVEPDPMRFMLVDVPPGQQEVTMRFELPLENQAGRYAFWLTAGVLVIVARRRS